ncbi:MAG: DciA family protein [Methylobacter sp.]|uniref:DciA family protein n=1 Tax=Candidatus Methylobacter titanis TaxID=3053457 RepID=A0AA43THB8_9GAMM|nr:DciA family protein [Candidatus Methylobacter titanis]
MAKKPTSFKAALSFPNRTMAHFYSQIEQQKQVLRRIHDILPAAIAKHALHCVINGKKLLVYTDTAAWASQLRFYNSVILAAIAPLTRESVSIMQIKVRVETLSATSLPGRTPIIPSAEKIAFIHNHSLTVSDEQLKLALLRLSTTLEKLSNQQTPA